MDRTYNDGNTEWKASPLSISQIASVQRKAVQNTSGKKKTVLSDKKTAAMATLMRGHTPEILNENTVQQTHAIVPTPNHFSALCDGARFTVTLAACPSLRSPRNLRCSSYSVPLSYSPQLGAFQIQRLGVSLFYRGGHSYLRTNPRHASVQQTSLSQYPDNVSLLFNCEFILAQAFAQVNRP